MAKLQMAIARTRDCLHRGVLSGLFLVLTACGGGGGSATPPSPPVATASSSISQGQAPLTVNFDASKSTDPQNFPLTYSWAFSDGATATGASPAHTFQNHGSFTATVAVNDGHNTTTSAPIAISVSPAPPTAQPLNVQVNVMGVAATAVPAQLLASDRESLALTYTLTTPPTVGAATVNGSTGAVTYTVPGYVTAAADSFVVTVANLGASSPSTVSVSLNSDPLLTNQWHIQNVGQNSFATTLPVAGNDMNVTGAWTAGYSGKGIKVGVVDTGIEAAHEDLAANLDLAHSINFLGGSDPTPSSSTVGFDHGTQVAGIIGAVAFNGKGGRGVAYNAVLRGYNYIAPGVAQNNAELSASLGGSVASADSDLFNLSIGSAANALQPYSQAIATISGATLSLRGGLGAAIVNAAGNDFNDIEGNSSPLCAVARQYGVSCGDPANDVRRGGDTPIVVGALNAAGTHASYSNTGSSLWISAPGGEFGLNSAYYGSGAQNYDPAIVTTSRDGCTNTVYGKAVNPLDDMGANPLATNCQYTAVMNGTSSATPNVSGVVALMLEANSKLSVRDIKYILAKTAKRVDPSFPGVSSTTVISGSTITLEQGWLSNGGGFTFSNRYGFGAVDAAAAVAMAKSYTAYLPAQQTNVRNYSFTATTPVTVPQSASGLAITYPVLEAFNTVEFVVVFVNIDSTPGLPCNQIELTSPAGTKSILLHAANGFTNSAIANSRFESNAFYGEPINGTWTLRFFDYCVGSSPSTVLSTTIPQTLLFAGH
jgi:subtilisin family serine protease